MTASPDYISDYITKSDYVTKTDVDIFDDLEASYYLDDSDNDMSSIHRAMPQFWYNQNAANNVADLLSILNTLEEDNKVSRLEDENKRLKKENEELKAKYDKVLAEYAALLKEYSKDKIKKQEKIQII